MSVAMGYAVVTPARNEWQNLRRLADSIRAQRHGPSVWVIVDDGSDDGTRELAAELAASTPWIRLLERTGAGGGQLQYGRREGRALASFRAGVESLQGRHEVVVKLDADLSFDDTYLSELVSCFSSNPRLGIASGACLELENGTWRRRSTSATTVWGASRAYRWEALDAVMDLEPRMGWDGLDELLAHRAGWQTKAFNNLLFRHHRPEHSREPGRWPAYAAQGRSSWYMGYRPSYLALRSVYRAREDIAALAMPWGYLRAAIGREPRFGEHDVRRALRDRQRLSRVLRQGAPE
jgi:cellulose synthase/poly-beta-1,6-N-acetylglucosamine synthase-like glycosyltransferase